MLKSMKRQLLKVAMATPTGALLVRLLAGKLTYNHMGLTTVVSADFMTEPLFAGAYRAAEATGSWHGADPMWNCYVACWAAAVAAKLPGDFVECGVNRGALSLAVIKYVGFEHLHKNFFLFDTFEGGDPAQQNAQEKEALGAMYTREGSYYDECFEVASKTFAAYPNVKLVRGRIPDSLSSVSCDKVSYLSIDMNCRAPEIAALDFFWERLVPGAIVVLDDYGWQAHASQKEGFDEFARLRKASILALPTGQGIIVKT